MEKYFENNSAENPGKENRPARGGADMDFRDTHEDSLNALNAFMLGLRGCGGDGRNAFGAGKTDFPGENPEGPDEAGLEDPKGRDTERLKVPLPPRLPRAW